jgi:hypothetical protein
VGIIYVTWAIAIMVFYGRDLWCTAVRREGKIDPHEKAPKIAASPVFFRPY